MPEKKWQIGRVQTSKKTGLMRIVIEKRLVRKGLLGLVVDWDDEHWVGMDYWGITKIRFPFNQCIQ